MNTGGAMQGNERGQILVIFAGGLIVFLAAAALVFDVGQNLLDWRTQRNAADAAALAAARYISDPACLAAPSIANCPSAASAALLVAGANGYGDLDGDGTSDKGTVTLYIPPRPGTDFAGQAGFVEVDIHTDRPSFFAGVLGIQRQNVDAMAIATNGGKTAAPYSMLSLNLDCDPNPSGQVGGNGTVTVNAEVNGEIHVNSDCDGALKVNGNGSLGAPECSVAGTAQVAGNANLDCTLNEGADAVQDPLYMLDPPPAGGPAAVEVIDGDLLDRDGNPGTPPTLPPIPQGCPGSTDPVSGLSTAATAANPVGCTFSVSETKYTIFRIHPGVYNGGLSFQNKVRVYLAPGVYWIAGGGFQIGGTGAQVISMDRTNVGVEPYPTIGKGVLIYNSQDYTFATECAADPAYGAALIPVIKPCIASFKANGGSNAGCPVPPPPPSNPPPGSPPIKCAWLHLEADDENGIYPGLVFFQDRYLASQPEFFINGDTGFTELSGTIYSPGGAVRINGTAEDSVAAQVISDTFKITGQGNFTVTYDPDNLFQLSAAGLVQ